METSFTEEAYRKHVEDDMKSIEGKREEQRPENVKPFLTGAAEQTKHISANFKKRPLLYRRQRESGWRGCSAGPP